MCLNSTLYYYKSTNLLDDLSIDNQITLSSIPKNF